MKLRIEEIKVGTRIRREIGDLSRLMESIDEMGLLQPVIVNAENELLGGLRRLEACRQLGWSEIEVIVVDTGTDDLKKLDLEYHENLGRLDLTLKENQQYDAKRTELLNPPKAPKSLWIWLKKLWQKIVGWFRRADEQ